MFSLQRDGKTWSLSVSLVNELSYDAVLGSKVRLPLFHVVPVSHAESVNRFQPKLSPIVGNSHFAWREVGQLVNWLV